MPRVYFGHHLDYILIDASPFKDVPYRICRDVRASGESYSIYLPTCLVMCNRGRGLLVLVLVETKNSKLSARLLSSGYILNSHCTHGSKG